MRKQIAVLILAFLLVGCVGLSSDPYTMRAAADAALQATQAARNDRAAWATLSAAQTQNAVRAQADLFALYAQATQEAFQFQQTQAAATQAAVQTATAYPLTATPLAATQAALQRKVEQDERRARWSQLIDPIAAVMPTVLLFAALVLLIVGVAAAFKRFLSIADVRGRAFSRGAHDSPVFLLREGGRVIVVDPDRNFGAALTIDAGKVESGGYAPSDDLQERVTARDQLADLMGRLPASRKSELEDWMKRFLDSHSLPAPTQPNIEIIEPGDAAGWLSEVEKKLLQDGEDTL